MSKTIVHVIANRPHGGIGAVLKNVERFFPHTDFTFRYLFSEDGKEQSFDRYVLEHGSYVHVLPRLSLRNVLIYLSHVVLFYKRYSSGIVAVHVHAPNVALFHFLCAKWFGVQVRILHSHNTRYSDNKIKGLRNLFLVAPAKWLVTHRCACGVEAAKFLFGWKHLSETFILHNAIEVSQFVYGAEVRNRKREELTCTSSLVFGHVGNFLRQKNHAFLIDIFAEVHKVRPDSILLLVGLGPLEQEVRDKVHRLGLDDCVRFLGYRSDIPQLLMAMDAFLFPSLFEGFPVSLVEAQCTGLPCFVADAVTKEAKITDNVQFLPITGQNAAKQWLDDILQTVSSFERRDQSEVLLKAGYDLAHEVKNLEQYYRRIVSEAYGAKGL